MTLVERTRFVHRATRLGHERLLAFERLRRRNPLVRALVAPVRRWYRRGAVHVEAGLGEGLRLPAAHLPVAHAHAGLVASGLLEVPVQETMRRLLRPGDVLYDVGANVGFFALAGARLVGPAGVVYALEPVPDNAAAIRAAAELNELPNIEVLERAAGRVAGHERLLLVEDRSWSRIERYGQHARTEDALEVEVVAIDDLVAEGRLRPPQLVKIDVEGAELDVLAGLRETIARYRPAIVCELHGTGPAFVELMDELGYATSSLDTRQPPVGVPDSEHALATPR